MNTAARLSLVVLLALALLPGCKPDKRERPYGFLRLGAARDLVGPENNLVEDRLLLKRDAGGWSAMSTLCAYDLSPLYRKKLPSGEYVWASEFNESVYTESGKVLHGPTTNNLPYYRLKLDSAVYGGPPDTLYVEIGAKVGADWRLPVPPQFTQ